MLNDVIPAVKDVSIGTRNSNFAYTSVSYVTTGVETSVVASAGDILLCGVSALWNSEVVNGTLALWSVVGGSAVNNTVTGGMIGTYGPSSLLRSVNTTIPYQVLPSDIDNGKCLLRLYAISDSAVLKTLVANAGALTTVWVVNLGPINRGGIGNAQGRVIGLGSNFINIDGDGALSVTSTSYVSTGLETTVPGSPGDLVLVGGAWLWWSEAQFGVSDVVTRVAGADVSYVSGNGSGGQGFYGWNGFQIINIAGGPQPYVLVPGDVAAGNVTFRLVVKIGSAGSKQLVGSNLHLWALNLGQGEL